MSEFHPRPLRGQRAFHIDGDAARYSSAHHSAAKELVASHLFGHRHHGQAERVRLGRDHASIILDGVKVDDVSVRRQFAALMQRNCSLDQSRITPPDQVEKHGDLPWSQVAESARCVDCTNLLTTIGSRQKRSEGDDAVVIVLKADVLFRRVADRISPGAK